MELPAGEEVKVQVPYGLPAVAVAVCHHPEPGVGKAELFSESGRRSQYVVAEAFIGITQMEKGGNVPSGDDENVVRRLG